MSEAHSCQSWTVELKWQNCTLDHEGEYPRKESVEAVCFMVPGLLQLY